MNLSKKKKTHINVSNLPILQSGNGLCKFGPWHLGIAMDMKDSPLHANKLLPKARDSDISLVTCSNKQNKRLGIYFNATENKNIVETFTQLTAFYLSLIDWTFCDWIAIFYIDFCFIYLMFDCLLGVVFWIFFLGGGYLFVFILFGFFFVKWFHNIFTAFKIKLTIESNIDVACKFTFFWA